ncbi:hypothetical protein MRB53_006843 [Persea americana]|uniref:Uncharacterized protein n=1 Tax=Persea americana TaxID=3435 RepID=A0ACC2MI44_PERAE|nr:hypothetical protein MRB53_006843 [Persea americana]
MGGGSLRFLFGSIAFVVFLGFLFVEILANGASTTTSIRDNFKQFKAMGSHGPVFHAELDPNYMSNRRVPNGPDPIHNRGAWKSTRPPGRAYP